MVGDVQHIFVEQTMNFWDSALLETCSTLRDPPLKVSLPVLVWDVCKYAGACMCVHMHACLCACVQSMCAQVYVYVWF